MDDYTFDFDKWARKYPLSGIPESKWGDWDLSGAGYPPDLARLEQIRSELAKSHCLGESVPCDVFTLGLGEPKRRDVTKINGLPYRPANLPWPMRPDNGEPMTFLAQFRFKESEDILPNLPGDVLLIFAECETFYRGGEFNFFHYEWYPLGLTKLVAAADLPNPAWEFITCYGVRHRTVDYVDKDQVATKVVESLFPDCVRLKETPWPVSNFVRLDALKIGGLPYFYCNDQQYVQVLLNEIPGRFLCSIPTIGALSREPDPYVNRPEPFDYKWDTPPKNERLYSWDGFILWFSVDDHGEVHWTIDLM